MLFGKAQFGATIFLMLLVSHICTFTKSAARKQIQDLHDRPRKQVDIFLKELLECGESGIYQSFLDALSKSEGKLSWLG